MINKNSKDSRKIKKASIPRKTVSGDDRLGHINKISYLSRWIILALLAGGLFVFPEIFASGNNAAYNARTKARHFYHRGVEHESKGNYDVAREYYRRAYETDTTYAEAALQYGMQRMGMKTDTLATSAEQLRSLRIMKRFSDQYPGDFYGNLAYAQNCQAIGQINEAIRVLEKVKEMNPDNSDILPVLGNLYLDHGDYLQALQAVDEFEKMEGEDLKLTLRKAAIRLAMGDSLGAVGEAAGLIERNPAEPRYYMLKGQLEQYMGRPDSALNSFRKAEQLSPKGYGGGVKMMLASYYQEEGDSVAYDNYLHEALLCEDLDFEVKHDVVASYLQDLTTSQNPDYARGDKLFEALEVQYPHDPAMLALSSRYNAAKGNAGKAYEEIRYAIDQDRVNPEYRAQAVMYLIMSDDYDKAVATALESRDDLGKADLKTFSLAATGANIDEKPEKALELLSTALADNFPNQKLGEAFNKKALGKYLRQDNLYDLAALYQNAGDVYYKLGKKPQAFECYENSLFLFPENPLTNNNYAYFLTEKDADLSAAELEKADEMSQRAIMLDPANPTYIDTRAWVLYRLGRYDAALQEIGKALEAAEEDGITGDGLDEFLLHKNEILKALGRSGEEGEK